MTSPARAAANCANAQLSTGPRTIDGKANSSRNAVKHGLASQQNFIAPGEEQAFAHLHDTLFQQLAPVGGLEISEFDIIVHASWSLRRYRLIEAELMQRGLDALLDERTAKTLDRLGRYAASHNRFYRTALKQLRAFQTERLARAVAEGQSEPASDLVSVAQVAKEACQFIKRTDSIAALFEQNDEYVETAGIGEIQNEANASPAMVKEVAA